MFMFSYLGCHVWGMVTPTRPKEAAGAAGGL